METREEADARREQEAREKGKALAHYSRKVTKELVSKPRRGKLTPSKRG